MLGTLVDTATKATAEHSPLSESGQLRAESRGPDAEQLDVYIEHKAEIDATWQAMKNDATLCEAMDEWLAMRDGGIKPKAESGEPEETTPLSAFRAPLSSSSCRGGSCRASSSSGNRRFGWRVRWLFGRR